MAGGRLGARRCGPSRGSGSRDRPAPAAPAQGRAASRRPRPRRPPGPSCARPSPTRRGRPRTTCWPPSASGPPTPTSCCPGCCASAGSTAATPRSPPSWRTAPCARRASSTSCSPACVDRPLAEVDPPVLDLLRLGAYQLLRTRVPPHAAVSATVDLARRVTDRGAGGVRQRRAAQGVGDATSSSWLDRARAGRGRSRPLALRDQPPALDRVGLPRRPGRRPRRGRARRCSPTTPAPRCTWCARPDAPRRARRRCPAARPGRGRPAPYGWPRASPGDLAPVRDGRAGVQDEGSQLVALALAAAPLDGPDRLWLDLCAGPGGKAALLAALAAERGAPAARRSRCSRTGPGWSRVRRGVRDVVVADSPARAGSPTGAADRVLLDAPVHRARRAAPAARGALAAAAGRPAAADPAAGRAAAPRPSARCGPAASSPYVTCSPHLAETVVPVADALRRHPERRAGRRPRRCCPACPTSATARRCSCGRTGTAPTRCSWRCSAALRRRGPDAGGSWSARRRHSRPHGRPASPPAPHDRPSILSADFARLADEAARVEGRRLAARRRHGRPLRART